MGKPFSEQEASIIKQKLMESCRACWERYGYKKTTVAEIAKMAGAATGTFYSFFESKEMLFWITADCYGKKIFEDITIGLSENPTREDLASTIKKLFCEIENNRWMLSWREDMEQFLRKLPANFLEDNSEKDLIDFSEVISRFKLRPKVDLDIVTAIFNTLSVSLYFPEIIGSRRKEALSLLVDSFVREIF